MSVSMSTAKSDDIPFMAEQISAGAKDGHFDARLSTDAGLVLIQNDVRSIVEQQRRYDDPSLTAHGLVFRENGQLVGFAVISDTPPQLPGKELYAYYIVPEQRGKGHGRGLLDRLKQRIVSKGESLFVRCLPTSDSMYELLCRSGFVCVGHNEIGARIMHHPPVATEEGAVGQGKNRR